jgi:hypothetical protein
VLALCVVPCAAAADVEFLPELALRMSAARYARAERDFRWVGWIGGAAGLARAGKLTLFGSADVETIIGNERRAFDANQANYHLEVGLRRSFERRALELFFTHVSRHRQDRLKPEAVDWNTLGLRLSGTLKQRPALRFELSAGHTTLASLVGYGFEGIAALEADLVSRPRWAFYLGGRARGVTASASDVLPRDGFIDYWLEGGFRLPRGARSLTTFVAYERRNDVYLTAPGERKRALLGIRFALADRARP